MGLAQRVWVRCAHRNRPPHTVPPRARNTRPRSEHDSAPRARRRNERRPRSAHRSSWSGEHAHRPQRHVHVREARGDGRAAAARHRGLVLPAQGPPDDLRGRRASLRCSKAARRRCCSRPAWRQSRRCSSRCCARGSTGLRGPVLRRRRRCSRGDANTSGWDYTLVDARRPDTWEAAFRPNTRAAPRIAHQPDARRARWPRPRRWAAPRLRRDDRQHDRLAAGPASARDGCDISLYSATKSIGGHSDLLAGAAMGSWKHLRPAAFTRMVFGPIADPAMAWMIERSLKTMPLRVRARGTRTRSSSDALTRHPKVAQVFYPGRRRTP